MPAADVFLPPDPVERYTRLHQELFAGKAWYQESGVLRLAALALVPIAGEPASLARDLRRLADDLARQTPWYSSLHNSIRFLFASVLLRRGERVEGFLAEVKSAAALFRAHWRTSAQPFESLAILALQGQTRDGRVTSDQVARLAEVWREMKRYHPWITQRSDWPAAALLCAAPLTPVQIGERIEAMYRELDARGYSKGDALQTASHILFFSTESAATLGARFDQIYKAFKDKGLWMHQADYDDVAMLCFAPQDPGEVAARVSDHRARIASLTPKPSKDDSFGLACGTALIAMLRRSADVALLTESQALLRIVAVVLAQQAAVIAASSAG
jgi:hypothetical protein